MARVSTSAAAIMAAAWMAATAACTMGPAYKRPVVSVPDRYRDQPSAAAASLADTPWWQLFGDPALNALIAEALKSSYDVRVAAARVEQARAQAGITASQGRPQAGVAVAAGRGEQPYAENATFVQANVNASWELDLWGRIRRLNEAARAQFLATEEARRGVVVSLVSDVAAAYFNLQGLDQQLAIARRTTDAFRETSRLFGRRYENGAASALETSRAEGALNSTAASVPVLERQVASLENQICLLVGRPPGPIERAPLPDTPGLPDDVPAGLPSSLLARRPDVRQAEQAIVAANASIGVAQASHFPTLSLTGLFGGLSPELSALFAGGRQWSVGASLAGPLLTGGRITNQKALAVAQWNEARVNYERAINNALADVASGLIAHRKLAEAEALEVKAVAAYREAVRLSNLRYESGLSAYFEVIDAMQQLFPVEVQLASLRRDRLVNYVELYRALGGGWAAPGAPQSGAPGR